MVDASKLLGRLGAVVMQVLSRKVVREAWTEKGISLTIKVARRAAFLLP